MVVYIRYGYVSFLKGFYELQQTEKVKTLKQLIKIMEGKND
jgi:hypothetical protein